MNGYVIVLALIALAGILFSFALVATNTKLQDRIMVKDKRISDLRKELSYWVEQTGAAQYEATKYRRGLDKIVSLRTVNMASIGQRMSKAAAEALR